jgi:hypothetical protein
MKSPGLLCAWVLGAWLLAAGAPAQTAPDAADSIKSGLLIMSQVATQTDQLVAARSYEQLPRQSSELDRGVAAVSAGITNQPSDFKSKVGPLLAKARVASNAIAEAAKTHNDAMLDTSRRQLTAAVQAVIDSFPAPMRPPGH